jgi:hypothetical protein
VDEYGFVLTSRTRTRAVTGRNHNNDTSYPPFQSQLLKMPREELEPAILRRLPDTVWQAFAQSMWRPMATRQKNARRKGLVLATHFAMSHLLDLYQEELQDMLGVANNNVRLMWWLLFHALNFVVAVFSMTREVYCCVQKIYSHNPFEWECNEWQKIVADHRSTFLEHGNISLHYVEENRPGRLYGSSKSAYVIFRPDQPTTTTLSQHQKYD